MTAFSSRRIPSVALVAESALRAATRMPMVLAAGDGAAIGASLLLGEGHARWLEPFTAACLLALPLMFVVTSAGEWRGWSRSTRLAAHGSAVALLGLFAWQWPQWTDSGRQLHWALLAAALHLLAAFAAPLGVATPRGFWQFNRTLFLRFLTAALYAAVLFAGLAAALAAIDVLFKARIAPVAYGRLFFADVFVFGTWFFVGGLPSPWSALDDDDSYPDGLRKFAQFVLIPLVALYLVILTVYLGKVLVTREWPSGWIGMLVSAVTIAGMLAWLLVHPLEEREEYSWVKPFTRGYYIALLPSIGMLWVALYKRIGQYGFTERRVIAVAGAFWLTGIAVYYIVSRSRNIRLLPVTLCALVAAMSLGPLSASAVARRDQLARLERGLAARGLLVNGKLTRAPRALPDSAVYAINEAVWYLRDAHGMDVFEHLLPDSVRARVAPDSTTESFELVEAQSALVMTAMGLPSSRGRYRPVTTRRENGERAFDFSTNRNAFFDISGFHTSTHVERFDLLKGTLRVDVHETVRLSTDSSALEVLRDGTVVLRVPFEPIIVAGMATNADSLLLGATSTTKPQPVPASVRPPLVFDAAQGDVRARLVLTFLSAVERNHKWAVTNFGGTLLFDGGGPPSAAPRP